MDRMTENIEKDCENVNLEKEGDETCSYKHGDEKEDNA